MRISIPSIPETSGGASRQHAAHTFDAAVELVIRLLQRHRGKTLIMTGAGVSVDSGIAPYRGPNGHYTVHKDYRPVFFHEFADPSTSSPDKGHLFRQRYWSRSFLGYPPVLRAKPNKTHYSLAALQRLGYFNNLITQNVDSLHHHATPSAGRAAESILELHGTLKNVVCVASPDGHSHDNTSTPPLDENLLKRLSPFTRNAKHHAPTAHHVATPTYAHNTPFGRSAYPRGCGFSGSRALLQEELAQRNPTWQAFAEDMRLNNRQPKTNPDGDVDLGNNVDYASFNYPPCPQCGGILKPAVIFFGESVPDIMRRRSFTLVDEAEAFILIGTSLATYSAFRLVKAAHEQGKQTLIINKGPTRADDLVDDKIDSGFGSSEILNAVAQRLAGTRAQRDPILQHLLHSGVTILPDRMRGVVSS